MSHFERNRCCFNIALPLYYFCYGKVGELFNACKDIQGQTYRRAVIQNCHYSKNWYMNEIAWIIPETNFDHCTFDCCHVNIYFEITCNWKFFYIKVIRIALSFSFLLLIGILHLGNHNLYKIVCCSAVKYYLFDKRHSNLSLIDVKR